MRYLLVVFFMLFGGLVSAEETIQIPLDKLPVGTVLKYDVGPYGFETRRVTANNGEQLIIEVLSKDPSKPARYSLIFNEIGLATELAYPSGRKRTFSPHNCVRVIGDCEYVFTNTAGFAYKRFYRSEYVDGTLIARVENEHGFVLRTLKSTFEEDRLMLRAEIIKPNETGSEPFVRRLVEVIRP